MLFKKLFMAIAIFSPVFSIHLFTNDIDALNDVINIYCVTHVDNNELSIEDRAKIESVVGKQRVEKARFFEVYGKFLRKNIVHVTEKDYDALDIVNVDDIKTIDGRLVNNYMRKCLHTVAYNGRITRQLAISVFKDPDLYGFID